MDDIIWSSKSMEHINIINATLYSPFECVGKEPLRHFLGMHIKRNDRLGEISIRRSPLIRHYLKNCRSTFLSLDAALQIYCNKDNC